MRLHRLTLTAFGPFAGAQRIDFDQLSASGLFLLHGPTGAGKTSVLDAVCFALYGSVPGSRQHRAPDLRSDHADPRTPTEVVLELTIGGRRMEITRRPEQPRPKRRGSGVTRDKAVSQLREREGATGGWRALSRSHQEIGEELGQLIGMSRDQFCQVVLLPQGDFARFLRAGSDDRGKLLGRLFDTRRFAAAEEYLAESRVVALQRVRGGDEKLLALAQRMRQAAGEDLGLDGHPPPELSPGDPALAGAVLEWAALARCAARERRDVADLAGHTAERLHDAAQRRLTDTLERDRLQLRHADALRRAALLTSQRDDREHTRQLLERARAADTVAPALSFRDAADEQLRAAMALEQQARHWLPAPLTDAPALRLAQEEREAREQLGALAAARQVESRAARLDETLAQLSREEATDQEAMDASPALAAAWEHTQSTLTHRIDRAQHAQPAAERLASQLDPVRRQLAAVLRRDAVEAELPAAEEEHLRAREESVASYAHWLDLKERRLAGIAAELAAALELGKPCAVCGSTTHPVPARPGTGHVDRAAEEAALAAHQGADSRRERAERQLISLRETHTTASVEADGETAEALDLRRASLEVEYAQARAEAADAEPARAELAAAERRHTQRLAVLQETERRAAARVSRQETLRAERAGLEEEVIRARGPETSVAARLARVQEHVDALDSAARAAQATEDCAARCKEADARLADAAYRADFSTPSAAQESLLDRAAQRALQWRLDEWRTEESALEAVLADPAVMAAAASPPVDPAGAQATVSAATQRLRAASADVAAARTRCAELDVLSERATAEARRLAPYREEARRITSLAGLTAGTATDNQYRMRLETYVLAARLEQVAAAASGRLHRMSAGRYTLAYSDVRVGGRGRSGLGLRVIDSWTGLARDTATLSGGESFFVSLALALGLADVVADEAGGQRLDTLFIDEGFGSLDEQSLDEVLDVLDSLRERDRSVGIVSHVLDLRARIPDQLEILKSRGGSTIRHRTVPHQG